MKKFVVMSALALASFQLAQAQPPGGGQRRTVEERVKLVHEKIDSAFKPAAAALVQIDSAFAGYYRAQDKMREEMMAGGERPDREVMRQKVEVMMNERNEKLKKLLTEEQLKIFLVDIEPALRPRRMGGGGGGGQ